MIEVLERAQSKRLTTLDALKTELGITDTSEDELLDHLIDQASALVETYCNRCFAKQTYREIIPGYGNLYLALSVRPVVSVKSVKRDGVAITDYYLDSPNSGLLYRRVGWGWSPKILWGLTWHVEPNSELANYEVEYTAGFVLPGNPDRTLPADIEKACLDIAKTWYLENKQGNGIQSESLGDYSVTYAKQADRTLPNTVLLTLDRWRLFI